MLTIVVPKIIPLEESICDATDILLSQVVVVRPLPRIQTRDVVVTWLLTKFECYFVLTFHGFVIATLLRLPKEDVKDAVNGLPCRRNPQVGVWDHFRRPLVCGANLASSPLRSITAWTTSAPDHSSCLDKKAWREFSSKVWSLRRDFNRETWEAVESSDE